jgi:hypothetical protein
MMRDRSDARWQVSPRRPDGSRGIRGPHVGPVRITPIRVVVAIALLGSLAYIAFAITVRDASQIPMLASGAAVLGIVFSALAVGGLIECYRAGKADDGRLAMLLAIGGGVSAMIAAGCFAGAMVLALVWSA